MQQTHKEWAAGLLSPLVGENPGISRLGWKLLGKAQSFVTLTVGALTVYWLWVRFIENARGELGFGGIALLIVILIAGLVAAIVFSFLFSFIVTRWPKWRAVVLVDLVALLAVWIGTSAPPQHGSAAHARHEIWQEEGRRNVQGAPKRDADGAAAHKRTQARIDASIAARKQAALEREHRRRIAESDAGAEPAPPASPMPQPEVEARSATASNAVDYVALAQAQLAQKRQHWQDNLRIKGAHAAPGIPPPMLQVEDSGNTVRVTNTDSGAHYVALARVRKAPLSSGEWKRCDMAILPTETPLPPSRREPSPEVTRESLRVNAGAILTLVLHPDCAGTFLAAPIEYRVGRWDDESGWWSDSAFSTAEQALEPAPLRTNER